MDSSDDIAIVGVSFKMPQDAEDELGFWKTLEARKNVMTDWPTSRANIDAFYDVEPGSQNKASWPVNETDCTITDDFTVAKQGRALPQARSRGF